MNAPKGKQFAIVIAPDGTQIKRLTTRTYTHAYIGRYQDFDGTVSKNWSVLSYYGSEKLAMKSGKSDIVEVIMSDVYPLK